MQKTPLLALLVALLFTTPASSFSWEVDRSIDLPPGFTNPMLEYGAPLGTDYVFLDENLSLHNPLISPIASVNTLNQSTLGPTTEPMALWIFAVFALFAVLREQRITA